MGIIHLKLEILDETPYPSKHSHLIYLPFSIRNYHSKLFFTQLITLTLFLPFYNSSIFLNIAMFSPLFLW